MKYTIWRTFLYISEIYLFFWSFSLRFFARIHFKLKTKKPNEVDWFAKVIRINRRIFYTSWYLTQSGLYGCATGTSTSLSWNTILWTLLPKNISFHWVFLSVLYLSMRCLYHKFYLRKTNKSFVTYCWKNVSCI